FDDAQWAIDHFREQVPLGLITDGTTEMQTAKVRGLDIAHHFAKIVFTHEGGGRDFHKPHPWSYQAMEAELGGPNAHYVYVGDNAAKDFITPNQRGWTSVQVKRPKTIHRQDVVAEGGAPKHVIASLRELPAILSE
ncbi:MAG: HAD family hydrolase, partial [Pseudomonadota bacterium]